MVPAERNRHRWYQFSLRALLLAVLAVSLGMGLLVVPIDRARRQRAAIKALRQAGWEVTCTDTAAGPPWLRRVLGDDFFAEAIRAHSHRSATDDEMARLRNLPRLQALLITSRHVTDAGLAHLERLGELKSLYLCTTQVGDEGLARLGRLTRLRGLYLTGTQVTDAGLVHLLGLDHLEELHLYNTRVTPEGVQRLRQALPDCTIWH